jgi:DNA-binding beta-propeller fold protein YncE
MKRLAVLALAVLAACGAAGRASTPPSAAAAAHTRHYEYVFLDGLMDVYDIDRGERLIAQRSLSGITRIRGVDTDIRNHMLYISHGGDGDGNGTGALAAYDLVADRIAWDRAYDRGVDSFAISRDGRRIYLPDGELSGDGIWTVLDARTGAPRGRIAGGAGAHNTIVGLSGRHVYLGGRDYRYLDVANVSSDRVVKRVGPLRSGVRPFTINGRETLAYTTATGFLGFQVSSITTGRVLYTRGFGRRFTWSPATFPQSAPSHGISLSPDERQLWVIDTPNAYVHVFDVTGVPRRAPRRIADIRLSDTFGRAQADCSQDCARAGWLQHSRSGCLVFVGDSGDVLSTKTFRRVGYIPALRDSREALEIDWRGGRPVATTTRSGLGYVTAPRRPGPPACR